MDWLDDEAWAFLVDHWHRATRVPRLRIARIVDRLEIDFRA